MKKIILITLAFLIMTFNVHAGIGEWTKSSWQKINGVTDIPGPVTVDGDLTVDGGIAVDNANGGAILNEASTSTNPSVLFDRSDETSGGCDNGTGTAGLVVGNLTGLMINDKGSWTHSQFFGNTVGDGEAGSNDEMFEFTGTLNDTTTTPGGTDDFTMLKYNLIGTDTTGYDTINFFNYQFGGTSVFKISKLDAGTTTERTGITFVDSIALDGLITGLRTNLTRAGDSSADNDTVINSNLGTISGSNWGVGSEWKQQQNNVFTSTSAGHNNLDIYLYEAKLTQWNATLTAGDIYSFYFDMGLEFASGTTDITADNVYGVYIKDPVLDSFTVTNQYGMYIEDMADATNKFGIYLADGTDGFWFETAVLDLSPQNGTQPATGCNAQADVGSTYVDDDAGQITTICLCGDTNGSDSFGWINMTAGGACD